MTKNADKSAIRKVVWQALRDAGAARFPGVEGRIPNFVGSEAACRRLSATDVMQRAQVIKSNPDSPQRTLRRDALVAGKRVYVAVPKLADVEPFILLDPRAIDPADYWRASSIKGSAELGRPVTLDQMEPIDVIVTGCVAVTRRGGRLGKGGGYADLEYGVLRERGLVDASTPIVTVVHPSQVLPSRAFEMLPHDTSIDLFATPDRVVRVKRAYERPTGVLWDVLDTAKRDAIPILRDASRIANSGE